MNIHPSSVISKEAEIGKDVHIGPFCVVVGRTKIGDGTRLESHVSLGSDFGIVELGKNNRISAYSAVGGPPQDLKYKGEPTKLVIGDNNVIRELVTINIGTPGGGGMTRIGNNCLIMSYAHVAHDCQLGDHVVISNSSQLAGHVTLEDHVKVSGMCGLAQFVRVGKFAYIGGDSAVNKDILPYTIAQGSFAVMRATNRIGLERAGYSKEDIESINRAVRIITKGSDTVEESLERIQKECAMSPAMDYFVQFLKSSAKGVAK
ncbi:MAG: acyl-ACP--UDP-N-acetylglucosamine O-acyltransferase [Bdellovibrionaceae bacterium]|nr:acyl-ACP--UDP-N-acetylglucosamine O-acyltransferase [Pseudobdellovibrionaceae bacterium]